jgi:polyhydroxyalkanoate synthesis regulator protein
MIRITQHRNKKLYVPATHKYTNLTEIKQLVKSGETVIVTEEHTGNDITSHILALVLTRTAKLNPENLRQLIMRGE